MPQTPFLSEQKDDSDRINQENRHLIYPYIFCTKEVIYDWDDMTDEQREYLDRSHGVDYSFCAKFPIFSDYMRFLVQYRFRDKYFQQFQDLTITLHNNASDLPGELSKLTAQLFVYGYYTKSSHRLIELLVADCQRMRSGILNETLPYTIGYNPRSDQPFVAIKFNDLKIQNMVLLHWGEDEEGKRRKLRTTIDPPSLRHLPYYGNDEEIA